MAIRRTLPPRVYAIEGQSMRHHSDLSRAYFYHPTAQELHTALCDVVNCTLECTSHLISCKTQFPFEDTMRSVIVTATTKMDDISELLAVENSFGLEVLINHLNIICCDSTYLLFKVFYHKFQTFIFVEGRTHEFIL
jgi:hypothetical protein